MGSAGDLRAYQCAFRVEYGSIHLFQCVASRIIITVSACIVKASLADLILLHGVYHFELVILRSLINGKETLLKPRFYLPAESKDFSSHSQFFIERSNAVISLYLIYLIIHHVISLLCKTNLTLRNSQLHTLNARNPGSSS